MGGWHSSIANSPQLHLCETDSALGAWLQEDIMGQGLLEDSLRKVQTWAHPCRVVVSVDKTVCANTLLGPRPIGAGCVGICLSNLIVKTRGCHSPFHPTYLYHKFSAPSFFLIPIH